MKKYIISCASIYSDENPDKADLEDLRHDENWFIVSQEAKDYKELVNEIDRNFFTLCSLMEENGSLNPCKYTVIQYYAKLNHLQNTVRHE